MPSPRILKFWASGTPKLLKKIVFIPRGHTEGKWGEAMPRLLDFRCLLLERGVAAAPVTNEMARAAPGGPGGCHVWGELRGSEKKTQNTECAHYPRDRWCESIWIQIELSIRVFETLLRIGICMKCMNHEHWYVLSTRLHVIGAHFDCTYICMW